MVEFRANGVERTMIMPTFAAFPTHSGAQYQAKFASLGYFQFPGLTVRSQAREEDQRKAASHHRATAVAAQSVDARPWTRDARFGSADAACHPHALGVFRQ